VKKGVWNTFKSIGGKILNTVTGGAGNFYIDPTVNEKERKKVEKAKGNGWK
jgi:hypothetical protein